MATYKTKTPELSVEAVFASVKKGRLDILLDYINEGGDLEATQVDSRWIDVLSLAKTIEAYLSADDAAVAFEKMLTHRLPIHTPMLNGRHIINLAVQHAAAKSDVRTPFLAKTLSMGVNLADLKESPLIFPVRKQNYNLVEYLLQNGANPNQPDGHSQDYPLRYAILTRNFDIFRLLLKFGANVEKSSDLPYTCDGLLHLAASEGLTDFVETLIAAGACLERQSYSGRTALMLAAEAGRDREVDLLIKAKAVIDRMDNCSTTALFEAASSGRLGAVKLLVSAGAEVDRLCLNTIRRTALMQAVEKNHVDVAVYLIGKGANPYFEHDTEKITPAGVARMRGPSFHLAIQNAITEISK
jgi:ankyrin repeat protein